MPLSRRQLLTRIVAAAGAVGLAGVGARAARSGRPSGRQATQDPRAGGGDYILTASATMLCAHGGTVSAASTGCSVEVEGAAALVLSDVFVVTGCPYTVEGSASPCVRVAWAAPGITKCSGVHVLTTASLGQGVNAAGAPQGPIVIASSQRQRTDDGGELSLPATPEPPAEPPPGE